MLTTTTGGKGFYRAIVCLRSLILGPALTCSVGASCFLRTNKVRKYSTDILIPEPLGVKIFAGLIWV
jgi:hypothetical protein